MRKFKPVGSQTGDMERFMGEAHAVEARSTEFETSTLWYIYVASTVAGTATALVIALGAVSAVSLLVFFAALQVIAIAMFTAASRRCVRQIRKTGSNPVYAGLIAATLIIATTLGAALIRFDDVNFWAHNLSRQLTKIIAESRDEPRAVGASKRTNVAAMSVHYGGDLVLPSPVASLFSDRTLSPSGQVAKDGPGLERRVMGKRAEYTSIVTGSLAQVGPDKIRNNTTIASKSTSEAVETVALAIGADGVFKNGPVSVPSANVTIAAKSERTGTSFALAIGADGVFKNGPVSVPSANVTIVAKSERTGVSFLVAAPATSSGSVFKNGAVFLRRSNSTVVATADGTALTGDNGAISMGLISYFTNSLTAEMKPRITVVAKRPTIVVSATVGRSELRPQSGFDDGKKVSGEQTLTTSTLEEVIAQSTVALYQESDDSKRPIKSRQTAESPIRNAAAGNSANSFEEASLSDRSKLEENNLTDAALRRAELELRHADSILREIEVIFPDDQVGGERADGHASLDDFDGHLRIEPASSTVLVAMSVSAGKTGRIRPLVQMDKSDTQSFEAGQTPDASGDDLLLGHISESKTRNALGHLATCIVMQDGVERACRGFKAQSI